MQRGAVSAAFRAIPFKILTFDELGLPPSAAELTNRPRGLVLVTGPTGSGKSTTLAALIDKINTETRQHIVTVEDPIEYLHAHKRCLINQREVGHDTKSFKVALKYVLRQDPDVVLVGEMRDLETIEAALTIAETGHLVFATLHTNSAVQSINRIIDVFPPHQQAQIRAQLSFVLEGVMSQLLLPRAGGAGRALALEVLMPNAAVRNLIREDKVHQIYSQMQIGQGKHGMQTMNQSLFSLLSRRLISMEEAMGRSPDQEELRNMIEGGQKATPLKTTPGPSDVALRGLQAPAPPSASGQLDFGVVREPPRELGLIRFGTTILRSRQAAESHRLHQQRFVFGRQRQLRQRLGGDFGAPLCGFDQC
jgi:twitching motility protein PilT